VLTVDVVDRHIEERPPRTAGGAPVPVLCTSRLLLKRGSLPKWAPAGIIKNSTSWVLEESEVDLMPSEDGAPRTMSTWTRNLDHTSVLAVTEALRFTEAMPRDASMTHCHIAAHVSSGVSFRLLRGRIEKFGLKRYLSHMESSRQGLVWSIHQIAPQLSGDPAPVLVDPTSRRRRLLHALRPPFLDGYPLGPWQWVRKKWGQLRDKLHSAHVL